MGRDSSPRGTQKFVYELKNKKMIDLRSKEFQIMCFLQDTRVQTGCCSYQKLIETFGEKEVKKCMYEHKIIFENRKDNQGMEWTKRGREYMGF